MVPETDPGPATWVARRSQGRELRSYTLTGWALSLVGAFLWMVRLDPPLAEHEGCMGVSAGPPGKAELGFAGITRSFHLSGALDRES